MDFIFKTFLFLWIAISVKQILFWVYLWQLKDYHIPRFLDHFTTEKGKKLILNKSRLLKIFILFVFIFFNYYANIFILMALYLFEVGLFLKQIIQNTLKRPKITIKTLILLFASFAFLSIALLTVNNINYFLFVDILLPLFVSCVVLLIQPFFVILRNAIIKKATAKIAKHKNLIVIGITGSYGKTTTKEFLTTILSTKFNVLSTKEHQNSEMGIANCILKDLNLNHEIFVVEMGAYRKGGIKLLADIVKPKIGIVTGVTVQHLSLFGSMENLLSAEGGGELADNLPKDGLLILNGQNKYCLDLYKKLNKTSQLKKKLYSEKRDRVDCDIWAEDLDVAQDYISFMALTKADYEKSRELNHFKVNILGKHNLQNILAAILVAKSVGMSFQEIALAVNNIKPEQAGIVVKNGIHKIKIIDSSYSSNPNGAIADLEVLNLFSGKRVVIMPCLIELGEKSKEVHKTIGRKIAEICDLAIITSKERFNEIKIGAVEAGMKEERIIFVENALEIFHTVTTFCKENDVVLLEGRVPEKLSKLLIN